MIGIAILVSAIAIVGAMAFVVASWVLGKLEDMEGLEEGVERRMDEREKPGDDRWCAGFPCGSNAMCYGCPANTTVGMGISGCGSGWGMM